MIDNIETKMIELSNLIKYKFSDINNLSRAMKSTKIGVLGKN